MAVTRTSNRVAYTADGATYEFPFTFKLFDASDLKVYKNEVLQSTGYSVVINSAITNTGGRVKFLTLPAEDDELVFVRDVPYEQLTDLEGEANLDEQNIVTMVDRVVMMAQQLFTQVGRSLRIGVEKASSVDLTMPDPEAGKVLGWNSDADGLDNYAAANGVGGITHAGTPTPFAVPYMLNATGTAIASAGPGTPGQVYTSNGPGVPGSFQSAGGGTATGLFKPANITSSARALPGVAGLLSGTYIHFGAWTTPGAMTVAHGTKIYINGNFTVNHDITGVPQNNGAPQAAIASGGANGGGMGGGLGGQAGASGFAGGGGGGAVAGGNGAAGIVNRGIGGGVGNTTVGVGGSGGGAGCANGAVGGFGCAGGGGGPCLILEVQGNVTLNANILLLGGAGISATGVLGSAGGAGGGGQFFCRASGTYTIAVGKKVDVSGGNGGNRNGVTANLEGGGGGAGRIEVMTGGAHSIAIGGHVLNGGTKGTGGSAITAAANGSNNIDELYPSVSPVSI